MAFVHHCTTCHKQSRVSGGAFTLPSHGTVLDSLPSHGSSYLTLCFKCYYIQFICKVSDMGYTHSPNERTYVCYIVQILQANHKLS